MRANKGYRTRGFRRRLPGVLAAGLLLGAVVFPAAASANLVDRMKDIYEAPDKLDAMEQEVLKSQELLREQTEAFEARQEALLQQNEALAGRNETLTAQNEALQTRMAHLEDAVNRKAAATRRIAYAVGTAAGLGLLYAVSIRLWRYSVWRRQRHSGGGA